MTQHIKNGRTEEPGPKAAGGEIQVPQRQPDTVEEDRSNSDISTSGRERERNLGRVRSVKTIDSIYRRENGNGTEVQG